ncbi:MAG TPA: tRNA preQ1(34) S-adenosylmethionine ribosyltransferase-isomerase QueA [Elusimicrobia bacterium]|nr:tRNA preQ1(34) S-adenosylmethionine ribosyltransferase-isomerase QueA [Elusimicrobiota bacterium]
MNSPTFRLQDYAFEHPDELVASAPAEPRDSSRLLVLDRASGKVEHALFSDIGRWLKPGDHLVLNRTKVLPVRLQGRKPTGGKVEVLLIRELAPGCWTAMASRVKAGQKILLDSGTHAMVESVAQDGESLLRFSTTDVRGYLARHGTAPLPPYILKKRLKGSLPSDIESYQTVYAQEDGSIAAPTAGLHFTPDLLRRLRDAGVRTVELTLHVGRGTFKPVTVEDIRQHDMLPERYSVPLEAVRALDQARREGKRVVAVGTTSVRVLETLARDPSKLEGETGLFIRPGHEFLGVDALLTNFHLPMSTPLFLACAFAGKERLFAAYREALERRYRLFSYGDAMLIA